MKQPPSLRELLRTGVRMLEESELSRAHPDTILLLSHAVGIRKEEILAYPHRPVKRGRAAHFLRTVRKRKRGHPLQHLTGRQEFYGRSFRVSPSVLIPRPETELLVDKSLEFLSPFSQQLGEGQRPDVLDLGTGSGCIAITLACELENLLLVATDISGEALDVARLNACRMQVDDRIDFQLGDTFEPVDHDRFRLIVSNPPYVRSSDPRLSAEVSGFEPHLALFAGTTGLGMYRRIFAGASYYLADQGRLLLEIGYGQASTVHQLGEEAGWVLQESAPDLAGIQRVLIFARS